MNAGAVLALLGLGFTAVAVVAKRREGATAPLPQGTRIPAADKPEPTSDGSTPPTQRPDPPPPGAGDLYWSINVGSHTEKARLEVGPIASTANAWLRLEVLAIVDFGSYRFCLLESPNVPPSPSTPTFEVEFVDGRNTTTHATTGPLCPPSSLPIWAFAAVGLSVKQTGETLELVVEASPGYWAVQGGPYTLSERLEQRRRAEAKGNNNAGYELSISCRWIWHKAGESVGTAAG